MPKSIQEARPATVSPALLAIVESLPLRPRSGELLGALVRAEQAGFERGRSLAMEAAFEAHRGGQPL